MKFIEVYRSSFTGRTIYEPGKHLCQLPGFLKRTHDNFYLRTVGVMIFRNVPIEKPAKINFEGLYMPAVKIGQNMTAVPSGFLF
jgi:hypothetical protein